MATNSKSKGNNSPTKSPENTNSNFNPKPTVKKRPTEEQIRQKAQEIYDQRLKRGEYGTEVEDWQKAEKILLEQ